MPALVAVWRIHSRNTQYRPKSAVFALYRAVFRNCCNFSQNCWQSGGSISAWIVLYIVAFSLVSPLIFGRFFLHTLSTCQVHCNLNVGAPIMLPRALLKSYMSSLMKMTQQILRTIGPIRYVLSVICPHHKMVRHHLHM